MRPDSWIPPYNLACLQALGGEPAGAMASLGTAVRLGFTDLALLDANDDFASLRSHPAWPTLEAEVRRAAAEGRKVRS